MARHAFVHNQRSRIFGNRQRKIIQIRRRFLDVADAVLIQSRRRSEIVSYAHEREWLDVSRQRQITIVLYPIRHGENILRFEKLARVFFLNCFPLYLRRLIGKQLQIRQTLIAGLLTDFKRRPIAPIRACPSPAIVPA